MLIWDEFDRLKKELETHVYNNLYQVNDHNFDLKKLH